MVRENLNTNREIKSWVIELNTVLFDVLAATSAWPFDYG